MKKQRSFSAISQAIKEQARTGLKGHKETIPINAAYTVFFLHLVLYIVRFLCAIVSVDYSILTPHILYAAFTAAYFPLGDALSVLQFQACEICLPLLRAALLPSHHPVPNL